MCVFGSNNNSSQFGRVFANQTVFGSRKLVPNSFETFYFVLNTLQHPIISKFVGNTSANSSLGNIHGFVQTQQEQCRCGLYEGTSAVLILFSFSFVPKTVVLRFVSSVLETGTIKQREHWKNVPANCVFKYTHLRTIHSKVLSPKLRECSLKGPFAVRHQ